MTDGLRQPRYPRWFKVLPCVVCSYPYSDLHHVIPVGMGGEFGKKIPLCPNHHRFAHIVYAWILAGRSGSQVVAMGQQRFDAAFNEKALPYLANTFKTFLDAAWQEEAINIIKLVIHGAKIIRMPQADYNQYGFDYSGPWYLAWHADDWKPTGQVYHDFTMVGWLVEKRCLIIERKLQEELIAWMFDRKYLTHEEFYNLELGIVAYVTDLGLDVAQKASLP